MIILKGVSAIFLMLLFITSNAQEDAQGPNVIIILTDDQGYGDIASHGSSIFNYAKYGQASHNKRSSGKSPC